MALAFSKTDPDYAAVLLDAADAWQEACHA
jgi:hypothetical protein